MRRTLPITGAVVLGLAVGSATAGPTYLDDPPAAHTGGFGEPSCAECHFDNPVNDDRGEVRIEGLPSEYEPGRTYTVTVEVRRPDMRRAGFQAAVRFAGGKRDGRQAGEVIPIDEQAAIRHAGSVLYVQHTAVGSAVTDGIARWRFKWTAPVDAGGEIVVHAAANAANDDDSAFGDYIYLAEAVSRSRTR